MADLKPIQRIFLHMVRDLALCDHVGDVGNDILDWTKIFGVDVPENNQGFDLDAIDELLACEDPGRHGEDFRVLVEAELLRVQVDSGHRAGDEDRVAEAQARPPSWWRRVRAIADAAYRDNGGPEGEAHRAFAAQREGLHRRGLSEAEAIEALVELELMGKVADPALEQAMTFVVEIEDKEERGLDQHAVFEILRTALPRLGFKLRTCGTRESMRQFANEQARLDREDLAELLTQHRDDRRVLEAEADLREQGAEAEPA